MRLERTVDTPPRRLAGFALKPGPPGSDTLDLAAIFAHWARHERAFERQIDAAMIGKRLRVEHDARRVIDANGDTERFERGRVGLLDEPVVVPRAIRPCVAEEHHAATGLVRLVGHSERLSAARVSRDARHAESVPRQRDPISWSLASARTLGDFT